MRNVNRRDFGKAVGASVLPLVAGGGIARAITSDPTVTVREQLAGHVARIRSAWEQSPPTSPSFAEKIFRLKSRPVAFPMSVIRRFLCGVNSAAVCGAPPGHLAVVTFRCDRRDLSPWELIQLPPSMDFPMVGAVLAYCSIPWDERARRLDVSRFVDHPPRDFDELLVAWDAKASGLSPS